MLLNAVKIDMSKQKVKPKHVKQVVEIIKHGNNLVMITIVQDQMNVMIINTLFH